MSMIGGIMKQGFTLAEVLITLGIIGVVAAMTIPTLIAKNKVRVTRTKVAHTYSILSQAYKLAYNEYDEPTNWELYPWSSTGSENFAKKLIPFMKVVTDCGTTTSSTKGSTCWSDEKMKYVNGKNFNGNTWQVASYSGFYKLVLIDGTALAFTSRSENCTAANGKSTYCGYILADIDGPKKGKNKLGDDVFQFYITEKGIFPQGGPDLLEDNNAIGEGWGTTWWILNNKNMDYLKCPTKLTFKKIRCN